MDYRHATSAFRVASGSTALQTLGRDLDREGATRVVVVTSGSLVREGNALKGVEAAIGDRLTGRFDAVRPHSPVSSVEALAESLHDHDTVVVVGGGSAVVSARAAVIMHGEQRGVRELCTRRDDTGRLVSPRVRAPKLPIWVVPSTPSTAYAKAGAAVRDPATGERLALFDPAARARGVVFDPEVAMTAPGSVVRPAALNAFAMAVESLMSNRRDPLADALLAHAVPLIDENLPHLDDADARLALMSASLLSGQGTDFAGGGLAQALAHAVGPRSDAANGTVEAILLPHAVRFADVQDPARLRRLAAALGSDDAPSAVESRLEEWQTPTRLREVGVDRAALDEAAAHAMDDWAITQVPRPVTLDDVRGLLQRAW